jgi:hypothetical protein
MRRLWSACELRAQKKRDCDSKWICSIVVLMRRLRWKKEISESWSNKRLRKPWRLMVLLRVCLFSCCLAHRVLTRVFLWSFGRLAIPGPPRLRVAVPEVRRVFISVEGVLTGRESRVLSRRPMLTIF